MHSLSEWRPLSSHFTGEFSLDDLLLILTNKRATRLNWVQAAEYIALNPDLAASALKVQKLYENALLNLKLTRGDFATQAFEQLLNTRPQVDNIGREKMEEIYFAGNTFSNVNLDPHFCTPEEEQQRLISFTKAVPDTVFIRNDDVFSARASNSTCCPL